MTDRTSEYKFKTPNSLNADYAQYWSFIQRFLSSDEPSVRFSKLIQLSSKLSAKQISSYSFTEQIALLQRFRNSIGDADNSDSIINLLLALEDLKRWMPTCFSRWLTSRNDFDLSKLTQLQKISQEFAASKHQGSLELTKFLQKQELTFQQRLWVSVMTFCGPRWSCYDFEHSKNTDKRINFIVDCLAKLKGNSLLFQDQIICAQNIFHKNLNDWRSMLPGVFMSEQIILVEGDTEGILLPKLCKILDFDFYKNAVAVIAAGGANQVARRYKELSTDSTLPILVVLDQDAVLQANEIKSVLREGDQLHTMISGEIEDVLDLSVFLRLLNQYISEHTLHPPVDRAEFEGKERRTEILDKLWRKRGLGDFEKIGFAKFIASATLEKKEIPEDVKQMVCWLKSESKTNQI